jgi:hypothetical protein
MMPLREIEGIENPNYRLTYGICINIMKRSSACTTLYEYFCVYLTGTGIEVW